MIEIIRPGPQATVQDAGRPGFAALGVPRGGAFDQSALRAANRLVGNVETAAAIECTFGGLAVHALHAVTVALTGAVCAGAPDWGVAVTLAAGSEFDLGTPAVGLRSYLAVRGGVDVVSTLSSRSTDTLSGLGPGRLQAGDRLEVGPSQSAPPDARWAPRRDATAYRVILGPRDDWFTREAIARLLDARWTVRDQCDRVGVRLDGPGLDRAVDRELPSEPTVPGAVQVPPDGQPIIFGPDAPVTGGYPVIAVLRDLDPVAQLRPGDTVRFGL